MEKMIGHLEGKEPVVLRVGERVFYTTKDILTKKECYFNKFFRYEKSKDEQLGYFIPRDGEVFALVLEFLTYGTITSAVCDIGILRKLVADAEYYFLEDLKVLAESMLAQAEEGLVESESVKNGIAKWQSTSGASNGSYWNWNIVAIQPNPDFYKLDNGNSVVVKKKGTYQVHIRVTGTVSGQYYIDLYANGAAVSRSYQSSQSGMHKCCAIDEVFEFNDNTSLMIYQTTNGSPYNQQLCNHFTIIKLA